MATLHFRDSELACKCGCLGLPPQEAQNKLEALRVKYGKPMIISSGYRCPEYNNRVAHTGLHGPHTTGFAFDIKVHGADALDFIRCALEEGVTGLGVAQRGTMGSRFIHIDWLASPQFPRPNIWSY